MKIGGWFYRHVAFHALHTTLINVRIMWAVYGLAYSPMNGESANVYLELMESTGTKLWTIF